MEEVNKPTIFFSHSSKDKDLVLAIKNKVDGVTGGTTEIFMSSDGQSIPFGTNWVHRIEEGLKQAKIMFVFMTDNSLSSGWIHFETGFAYSKGIKVIPIGIGVDIGSLSAPMNLLQGFNIVSEDGLNNIIDVIDKTFGYAFECSFTHTDYSEIIKHSSSGLRINNLFESIVDTMDYDIYGKSLIAGKTVERDIDRYFKDIVNYLDQNGIHYSREDGYQDARNTCIVTSGLKIVYRRSTSESRTNPTIHETCAMMNFSLSPHNFDRTFLLYKSLIQLFKEDKRCYLRVYLKDDYSYTVSVEDGSALLLDYPDFCMDSSFVSGYENTDLGIKFYIFKNDGSTRRDTSRYIASFSMDKETMKSESIILLVEKLKDIGFIN